MRRYKHIGLWFIGLALLVYLLMLPVEKTEMAWDSWSLPLSGKTIVIDPGHGGPDGGAVGADGTEEKDIALNVSFFVREYLEQGGATVYLTREIDTDLAAEHTKGLSNRKTEDIKNRLAFIEEKDPALFLTIHLNAIPSPKWRGAQTFYYPRFDESKHLAKMIQDEIIRNLENTTREALPIQGIYLLKHAEVPSTIVELGFLSNPAERDLLKQEEYQRKMAASIYQGILRYETEEFEE
ncbi:MAG TPA: N-acetylmuramoyl-L-alanine amidase CwlD [Bacillota bacterium]|nr:N-acetylmuramoyl-L-alanine amidase CwlD [Bacillota bacterium]